MRESKVIQKYKREFVKFAVSLLKKMKAIETANLPNSKLILIKFAY